MGKKKDDTSQSVTKDDAEWRNQLTPEQYHVTREAGTERAFSGPNWDAKTPGTYHCICCNEPLFSTRNSRQRTGWPSFFSQSRRKRLLNAPTPLFMKREVVCSNCGAHLGHVFPDGPPPTGQRYCITARPCGLSLPPPNQPTRKPKSSRDILRKPLHRRPPLCWPGRIMAIRARTNMPGCVMTIAGRNEESRRTAGDIRAHLEAENVYTDTIMQPTQELKTRLKKCAGVLKKMTLVARHHRKSGWLRAIAKTASMCWFAGVGPTRMSKSRSRLMEYRSRWP